MISDAPYVFKPVQVPCTIRPGFTFTVCLTKEEAAFLALFQEKKCMVCTVGTRKEFEITDISELITKSILCVEEKVTGIYYTLTELGKRLIDALGSECSPISILDMEFAKMVAIAQRRATLVRAM